MAFCVVYHTFLIGALLLIWSRCAQHLSLSEPFCNIYYFGVVRETLLAYHLCVLYMA